MAVRLMNQSEAKRPTASGHWLGSEIFYTVRFHARTYDGIKVTSSYTTGEIRLTGQGGFLKSEVKRLFHQFASLYITEADLDAVRKDES